MRRHPLLCLFLSAALSILSLTSLSGQNDEKEKATQEASEFQLETSHTSRPTSDRLADLINLFPIQRGGRFRGSIYEFHRNDNFDARNFFDPPGKQLPEYKRNQFGFSFGTTIGTRFNFHSGYDGLRIIRGSTILSHVPTPAMKKGDFSELLAAGAGTLIHDPKTGQAFDSNLIPAERLHPVAKHFLSLLPDPNRSDPDRNFVTNQPDVEDRDRLNVRSDLLLSQNSNLFFSYALDNYRDVEASALPGFGTREQGVEHEASIRINHSFSSHFVISQQLSLDREIVSELPRIPRREGLVSSLGILGVQATDLVSEGFPEFQLAGYRSFGDEGTPGGAVSNRFELGTDLTWVKGDHRLQVETEISWRQINNHHSSDLHRGRFTFSGLFSGDSFADFLLGIPESATRAVGSSRLDLRAKRFKIHLQDEWNVHPRLTLSFGLGLRYYGPFRSIDDNVSLLYPLLFEPPLETEWVVPGSDRASALGLENVGQGGMVSPNFNDWSPRLGLAYRPFGDAVIRASYGLFYDPLGPGDFLDFLGRNFPFYYIEQAQSSRGRGQLDLSQPFNSAASPELTVRQMAPEIGTPSYHSWRLEMESQVGRKWVVTTSYRGQRGIHLERVVPGNIPLPGPGSLQERRPNSEFGEFYILTSGGASKAHRLELEVERRFYDGLSAKFEYDWAKEINDDFDGELSNPRDLRAEWAPEDNEIHELSLHYILQLPVGPDRWLGSPGPHWLQRFLEGWHISGVTRIRDGGFFSVFLPGDFNNDGLEADRPDRLTDGRIPADQQTLNRWFETNAFAFPQAYGFGNAGRNVLRSPGTATWDVSLAKNTLLPNGHRIQIRLAIFNALNHANFDQPGDTLGTRLFGKIDSAGRAREIEIALKYMF